MSNNIPEFLKNVRCMNGIYHFENVNSAFEGIYISVREKEGYLFDDNALRILPKVNYDSPNYLQWRMRANTASRFVNYVNKLKEPLRILEIGCGNGWFSNTLAQLTSVSEAYGIDINLNELNQASRVFKSEKIYWLYGDISKICLPENYFDLVIFNASIQYFEDLQSLLNSVLLLLKTKGEIHIMDSPFYNSAIEAAEAKSRSEKYFTTQVALEMIKHYHHHQLNDLVQYEPEILYAPVSILRKLFSLAGVYTSPFYWLLINKSP